VIAGHVDSQSGPDVFYSLASTSVGDEIAVARADGSTVRFRVDEVQRVDRDAFPTQRVYGETDKVQLRLVTCGGEYDEVAGAYEDNVIVYASRAS
jgi:Sortase domain